MDASIENNLPMIADPSGGANQTRVRDHNQRLVLSLVRRHGSLSKAEIAVRSKLSAQTVTVIMRVLERDGLLLRGEPVRGKVGQPSIPMSLNPEAVYSIGLKIGRRSADLVLVDFEGNPQSYLRQPFAYPSVNVVRQFATQGINTLKSSLPASHQNRIAGIGVALPHELWSWADNIDAPQKQMDKWRSFDFATELCGNNDLPLFIQNDATSACGAELTFGHGTRLRDFVYFYIGTFAGGGIVLGHTVFCGRSGNAGALGSMPVTNSNGKRGQLIDHASVIELEKLLRKKEIEPSPIWLSPDNWDMFGNTLNLWVDSTAKHLASAIVSSCCVIDFEAAVIDGAIPDTVKQQLVSQCRSELQRMDSRGLSRPHILAGQVGRDAKSIGGASLPLFSRYLLDQSVLTKTLSH